MSRSLVALLENKLVQHAVAAARPTTDEDGVSILSWRTNGEFSGPIACVFIDGSLASTLDAPTDGANGPELWGYRLSQWWRIGYVNDGQAIELAGNLQGYVQEMNVIGIFERLCIAGTASAGAVVAKLAPIDSWTTA